MTRRVDPDLTLIRLLGDGRMHSGEAIAKHLGVSRAAVWKALRRATERYGLALCAVRGQGYRLPVPLELLDPGQVLSALSEEGRSSVSRLEIHDEIDSTNAHLMSEAGAGAPSGAVCLAERQSAGRGRRGRVWVSPFGVNLYLSVLWRYPLAPSAMGGLSLAAGAAIVSALSECGVPDLALKWPNDILWQRRKLAGVLLEVAGEAHGPSYVVVGVGINLRMDPNTADAIDQPWTNLSEALGDQPYSRNRLAAGVIEALTSALDRYGRDGLLPFLPHWERFDAFRGERVRVVLGDRATEGLHAGIADDGALLLRTADGVVRVQAGEVSLRATEAAQS